MKSDYGKKARATVGICIRCLEKKSSCERCAKLKVKKKKK
jgi:hypothetical protein